MRTIEFFAVALNLLFTWLYAQGNPWCFVLGVISPMLYAYITYQRRIFADCALQFFYIATTVWGYWRMSDEWQSVNIATPVHAILLAAILVIAGISGRLLKKFTDAAVPTLDSTITCLAVVGTVLMMCPAHSCWLYLLAANILSLLLYAHRGLYLSCGMFFIYILMCIDAYWHLGWLS